MMTSMVVNGTAPEDPSSPQEEVQEDKSRKNDTRDQQRCECNVKLPLLALHGLVCSGRGVASGRNQGECREES